MQIIIATIIRIIIMLISGAISLVNTAFYKTLKLEIVLFCRTVCRSAVKRYGTLIGTSVALARLCVCVTYDSVELLSLMIQISYIENASHRNSEAEFRFCCKISSLEEIKTSVTYSCYFSS